MRSKHEIEMDFKKAVTKAEELESISGKIIVMANEDINDNLNAMDGIWKSENSKKVQNKGIALVREMLNTADELNRIAKNIRASARSAYNAEKRSLSLY